MVALLFYHNGVFYVKEKFKIVICGVDHAKIMLAVGVFEELPDVLA